MKRALIAAGVCTMLLSAGGALAESKAEPAAAELKGFNERVSYSIGLNMGRDFQKQQIEINADLLAQGVRDALADKPRLNEEEVRETLMALQTQLMEKQQVKLKELSDSNLKEGEAFLAENAKKDGVVTLPSGLQYKVIEEGSGKTPGSEDTVKVHYRGTLVDGTEFDSSHKRGEPAEFPVTGVIPGWTEALQLMKEGAKWQVFIPAALGYGERGAGGVIQPNSTLVFDVELLEIKE